MGKIFPVTWLRKWNLQGAKSPANPTQITIKLLQTVALIKRKPAVPVGNSCWEQTASEKERKFTRNKRKQLKVETEIEAGLQIVRSIDFTKAFFSVRMSYGFNAREKMSLHFGPQAKCDLCLRRF